MFGGHTDMVRWVAGLLVWASIGLGAPAAAAAARSCLGKPATIVSDDKRVSGTPADDVIVTLRGVRSVTGGPGDDRICIRWSRTDADGGAGRDRMAGSPGYLNVIAGGRGDDVLFGRDAHLWGGQGDDVLTGTDLAGNAGDDVLRSGDFRSMTVYYRTSPRPIVADLPGGTVRGEGLDRLEGRVHRLYASRYDDVLVAAPYGSGLVGGRGSDELTGGPGDDELYGDFVGRISRSGNRAGIVRDDVIRGGGGGDRIQGGVGVDLVLGGRGRDTLDGDGGADTVYAGRGDDQLRGGKGDDHLGGGTGRDWVTYTFSTHADLEIDLDTGIALGVGTDRLLGIENAMGGNGKNTIRGDDGPNILHGGLFEDDIQGRGGDDYLWGIASVGMTTVDVLDGGEGFDVCRASGPPEPDLTIGCEETPG